MKAINVQCDAICNRTARVDSGKRQWLDNPTTTSSCDVTLYWELRSSGRHHNGWSRQLLSMFTLFFVALVAVNTTSNGRVVKFFVMRDIHSVEMDFCDVLPIKNERTELCRVLSAAWSVKYFVNFVVLEFIGLFLYNILLSEIFFLADIYGV